MYSAPFHEHITRFLPPVFLRAEQIRFVLIICMSVKVITILLKFHLLVLFEYELLNAEMLLTFICFYVCVHVA
jgi:hypothetical protein